MKLTKTLIVSALASLVIIGGVALSLNQDTQKTDQSKETTDAKQEKQEKRTRTDITYTAKEGKTSLEQLRLEADGVVTKQSEYGEYVDTIEGHVGGTDGYYWSFYVDGTMSDVGAGSYTQKGGETIQWKFQKL